MSVLEPPMLKIPVPVHLQKKASTLSRILFLNLLVLPLQFLLAAPLLSTHSPEDYTSGVMLLLGSEALVLFTLILFFSLSRKKPDSNRAWELVLTPYQLSLQNGAVPTYLVKSLSYRRNGFRHESALLLNGCGAEGLPAVALDMNLPEAVYTDLCEQVNAFLNTHQQAIAAAAQAPLSEAMPYLDLPVGCRMHLQVQEEGYQVSLPAGLEDLEFYDQTVLLNPESFRAVGRVYLSFSATGLTYKNGRQSQTFLWNDLHGVTLERVKKETLMNSPDFMTTRRIRYYDELTLHGPGQSILLASVFEDVGLRHQLLWLQDLILRQQKESLSGVSQT